MGQLAGFLQKEGNMLSVILAALGLAEQILAWSVEVRRNNAQTKVLTDTEEAQLDMRLQSLRRSLAWDPDAHR